MNFKLTKIKTILSIIISTIAGIWVSMQPLELDGNSSFRTNFAEFVFSFAIVFVLIYLIWSLFDKKDNQSFPNIVGIIIGLIIGLAILIWFLMEILRAYP